MNCEEIMLGVRACVANVVDKEVSRVSPEDRIIEDLGADSLDLLDLVFQLEQRFKIKISPRGIEKRVREQLGETPLEIDGVYTREALELLRHALPEVPQDEFQPGLRTNQLPYLFRVMTFANLCAHLLEERP